MQRPEDFGHIIVARKNGAVVRLDQVARVNDRRKARKRSAIEYLSDDEASPIPAPSARPVASQIPASAGATRQSVRDEQNFDDIL